MTTHFKITQGSEGGFVLEMINKALGTHEIQPIMTGSDQEDFEELVYALAERVGFSYDKYSNKNVNVEWNRKGHKLDDVDPFDLPD